MSSTSSSSETRRVPGQSTTEELAARYRHLFVLPSKGTLVALNLAAALAISVAGAGWRVSVWVVGVALLAALLFPFVIARASRAADGTTIATFRRSLAATFAGTILWLVCAGVGLAYSSVSRNTLAFGNSVVFGAFLCGGFETLVVNGAFLEQTPASTALGSLQPAFTLAAILLAGGLRFSAYVVLPGVAAFAVFLAFIMSLKRRKTTRGHNGVKLFQAFMKTWAGRDASMLESIISSHAEKAQVSSKVLRFLSPSGDLFLVLPGVHPGPFFPVGSYNLPGLIANEFGNSAQVLTLHRPGGHERNLATNADAKGYAKSLREFALSLNPTRSPSTIQGPSIARIGKATVTLCAFSKSLLLTVSFAPYGSEDLELGFEDRLGEIASSEGYDVAVVDAHNSIDNSREAANLDDSQWHKSIQDVKRLGLGSIRVGFAHSKTDDFKSASDITANGLGVAVIEANNAKWVIALADANNAVSELRSKVSKALEASGYRLLEFCTSDSHDLAARGLTVNRGYKALGEATSPDVIADATARLARLAESRLAACEFAAGTMTSQASLFGAAALEEFAGITRESSAFAKRFAQLGALSLGAFLLLGLVL